MEFLAVQVSRRLKTVVRSVPLQQLVYVKGRHGESRASVCVLWAHALALTRALFIVIPYLSRRRLFRMEN